MKAKQKPLESITMDDLGVNVSCTQKTLKVSEPPVRQGGRKVKDVQELVNCLRNEAKVI